MRPLRRRAILSVKTILALPRTTKAHNDSLVRREFSNLLTPKDEAKIREAFTDPFTEPDDDINTSVDQTKNLRAAIAMGLKYPDRVDGRFNYDDVLAFLEKLSRIFKWGKYEASTLGKPTLLRWYAVVLIQWMEGTGLSNIMKKALEYRQQHRDNFWVNRGQKEYYDDGLRHRNIVFADTLEVIDVLCNLSEYMKRKQWWGACHASCSALYVALSELGYSPKLCIGEMLGQGLYFDHSWIELDGQILDIAISMTLLGGAPVSEPIVFGKNIRSGKEPVIKYGVPGRGIEGETLFVNSLPFVDYMDGFPDEKNGLWGVVQELLGRKVDIPDLREKYKDVKRAIVRE